MEIECGDCEGTGEGENAPCEFCAGIGFIEVDPALLGPDTGKEADGSA
jgi:DnaJ-class molecular chaperone